MANGVNGDNGFNKFQALINELAKISGQEEKTNKTELKKEDISSIFERCEDKNNNGKIDVDEFLDKAVSEFDIKLDITKLDDYQELIDDYAEDFGSMVSEINEKEEPETNKDTSGENAVLGDAEASLTFNNGSKVEINLRDDLTDNAQIDGDATTGKFTITFGKSEAVEETEEIKETEETGDADKTGKADESEETGKLTKEETELMSKYTEKFDDYVKDGVLDFENLRDEVLNDMAADSNLSVEAKMQLMEEVSELIGEKNEDGIYADGKQSHQASTVLGSIMEQINADDSINVNDSLEYINRFYKAGFDTNTYTEKDLLYNLAMLYNKVETPEDFEALYNNPITFNTQWSYHDLSNGQDLDALKAFFTAADKTGWFDKNDENYISPEKFEEMCKDGKLNADNEESKVAAGIYLIQNSMSEYKTYNEMFQDKKYVNIDNLVNMLKSEHLSDAQIKNIIEKNGIDFDGKTLTTVDELGTYGNPYRVTTSVTIDDNYNIVNKKEVNEDHTHNDKKIVVETDKDGNSVKTIYDIDGKPEKTIETNIELYNPVGGNPTRTTTVVTKDAKGNTVSTEKTVEYLTHAKSKVTTIEDADGNKTVKHYNKEGKLDDTKKYDKDGKEIN